jgi:capsular polysaccharide biosynthesis protein
MKMILDKLWLLILIIIIFGLSAYSITSFLIKPRYQSSLSFFIQPSQDADTNSINSQTKPNYIQYTKSDEFLNQIKSALYNEKQISVTIDELKSYITVESDNSNSTEFIITATTYEASLSYEICRQIYEKGHDIYKGNRISGLNLFKGTEVNAPNEPRLNVNPISPNTPLNTVLGILLGVIFGISVIILIETVDNSIKDENDLIDNYEVPLLGIVYTHRVEATTESAK